MTELTETIYINQREIEQAFAASAFIAPDYVIEICGWLRPEMLRDERIKKFWELLKLGKGEVDASIDAGLATDIYQWVSRTPTSLGARDYANQISKHNYLAAISSNLSLLAINIGKFDAEAVRSTVQQMAEEKPANDVALKFIEAIVQENRNVMTGIPGLDNNTGGLEKQTMSVIAGRPSMGKTAIALQIGRNASGPEHKRVYYFSLEMSDVSLWARMTCPKVDLTWMDVRAKKMTEEQEARLFQASDELMSYYGDRLIIDPESEHTTDTIWQAVANVRPDLVIIDHLGLMSDKEPDDVKRLGNITKRLKAMAKKLDCHVMVLHQLNRSVEARNDKRPMLSDLRDSGHIEENADQVFMLYRDSYYNPPNQPSRYSDTELWIRKFRDGIKDAKVRLIFDERAQWFDPAR